MNAIFALHQLPLRQRTLMYALVLLFSCLWAGMMFASANRMHGVDSGIASVMVVSFVLIAAIGAVEMRALAALWRRWVAACVVETSLLWAFVCLAMMALLASRGSTMPWRGALALLSSGLCFGAVWMLALYARVPERLSWLANGLVAAMLICAVYMGTVRALEWFVGLPVTVHALLALSWPLLACLLTQKWRGQPATFANATAASRKKRLTSVANGIQRYSPLDADWARKPHAERSTAHSRLTWVGMDACFLLLFSEWIVPLRWEQQPDLRQLLSLVAMCLMMSHALVARDLHWRWLLAPGGWPAGRIASAVFASTFSVYFAAMAAAVLANVMWARLVQGTDAMPVIQTAVGHVLLLAEVAFAISVALALRAIPRRAIVEWIAGLTLLGLWTYAGTFGDQTSWKAPAAGALYGIVLAAATYALLRLADRLWTKEKLMACARGAC
jgi:hypothetical protein